MMATIAAFVARRKFTLIIVLGLIMSASLVRAIGEPDAEVSEIVVLGDLSRSQLKAVRAALGSDEMNLADIDAVKAEIDAMNWVRRVGVAYRWPDRIVADIEVERPIAYWNTEEFINQDGHVFSTDLIEAGDLPLLFGPQGAEQEVMARYQSLSRMLLGAGHVIDELQMSERGTVRFRNQYGTWVELGNVDVNARVNRFLRVMAAVADVTAVESVDTRYEQGVAVKQRASELVVSK